MEFQEGEFLLQLLQGGGGGAAAAVGRRVPQQKVNGERGPEGVAGMEEFRGTIGVEDVSGTWQLRDPAVAALGPSHSFHGGGEVGAQLLQSNQLFMPPQYGGLTGGGVWATTPQQHQQQHQFFPPSLDPRGYGGLHVRGPHQLLGNQFSPYPPPPPVQASEQAAWRADNTMLEFSRRSDAPWLPPPHVRQGISDGGGSVRPWSGSVQGSVLKTPLPPPLPTPPTPPQQQFHGNGAELLQLLLRGTSQSPGAQKPSKATATNTQVGVSKPGFAEELFGKGLTGGIQVENVLPRPQVHGPIGPPKRNEASQPEQSPSGAEDLLGRLWATPSSLANGSPEHNRTGKPGLAVQENRLRNLSLSGALVKEDLSSPFDPSKTQQQRTFGLFGDHPKPGVSKPPGFSGERDHISGLPLDSNIFPSATKASTHFSDFQGAPKGLIGVWDNFQEGAGDLKPEIVARPSDDRGESPLHHFLPAVSSKDEIQTSGRIRTGYYQMQQNPSHFAGPVRSREEDYEGMLKSTGPNGDDATALPSTDFPGSLKDNEISAFRELARIGGRGTGRRGGPAKGDVGRSAGRMATGQWVAVNEKQRDREVGKEGIAQNTPVYAVEGSAERLSLPSIDVTAPSFHSSPLTAKTGASGKDDSPSSLKEVGSGGKLKEDIKRRRGQIQEWRMKQISPPQSKRSEPPGSGGSSFQQDVHPTGILPLASQVDHPGLPSNMVRHSMPGSAMDESKQQLQHQLHEGGRAGGRDRVGNFFMENGRPSWEEGLGREEEEDLMREFSGYSKLVEDTEQLSVTPPHTSLSSRMAREEAEVEGRHENLRDSREVRRHQQRMSFATNVSKGDAQRLDFEIFTPQLLSIYKDLIPPQEEVQKRRKFLDHVDRLVSREWAGAKLFLFGSCANDFGVCNSDIDVCLSVNGEHSSKAELVMKMAGILRSDNMQSVQALTHARVPIVKFTDPDTGINCDICVNNMLAVVNSKLLHDYSQVDPRLRQLAFLVKHWAKQRQVNETYRGTLSSYAYVLMCIHFLQQRKPAILPCLQNMQPTYEVTVGKIKCAYYDKVDTLKNFGAHNKELVGELLSAFFEYWAFRHDYNHLVISVRTGGYLSKDEKDWTRRVGNERHLICIEDPFENTHDLGRVVDRHSIRVLRDEFNRAARILRHDPSPATALFEPFIREKV